MVRLNQIVRRMGRFGEVVESLKRSDIHTGEELIALVGGLEEHEIDLGKGIDTSEVCQLVEYLETCYAARPERADQWLRNVKQNAVIVPTGSTGVDSLLMGGMVGGELVELVGRTATGKTQLCLYATLHTIVHEGSVIFIDSSNCFPAQRIASMYAAHLERSEGYEPPTNDIAGPASAEEFLAQILQFVEWKSAYTADQLIDVLLDVQQQLENKRSDFYENVRLLVIDSLAATIAPALGGRDGFVGHSVMSQIGRLLKIIAKEQDVAVLYTNYTVGGDGRAKPALGDSWSYVPNVRIQLNKHADTGKRTAELLKSSRKAIGEQAEFALGREGVVDIA